MTIDPLFSLAGPLVQLQVLAVAWTVNQQINAPRDRKQGTIGLPDLLNLFNLFSTLAFAILLPLATGSHVRLSRSVLCSAYVLIGFYPLTVAAHYGLWRRGVGRAAPVVSDALSYANDTELWFIVTAIVLASAAGVASWAAF